MEASFAQQAATSDVTGAPEILPLYASQDGVSDHNIDVDRPQPASGSFGQPYPSRLVAQGSSIGYRPRRRIHERSRNLSAKSVHEPEQGMSSFVHVHRSPYPSSSSYFLTVVPPTNFPLPLGSSESFRERIQRGSLLPLYPTLGGQLWAISREYGLPSVGGLLVYFVEDQEGNMGPRIGDATWHSLWEKYFRGDDSAFFSLSELPPSHPRKVVDHRPDLSDSVINSRRSDRSRWSDAEVPSMPHSVIADSRPSPNLNGITSLKRDGAPDWSPSSRSITWSAGRGSLAADRTGETRSTKRFASRLPIVGKIEWMVDETKATWWDAWAARRSSQQDAKVTPSSRRSMHLAAEAPDMSSSRLVAESSQPSRRQSTLSSASGLLDPRSPLKSSIANEGDDSISEDLSPHAASANGSQKVAPLDHQDTMIVEREAQDETTNPEGDSDYLQVAGESSSLVDQRKSSRSMQSVGDDSYAGYSALLDDADEQERSLSEPTQSSTKQPSSGAHESASGYSRLTSRHHADADEMLHGQNAFVLTGNDEAMWRDLQDSSTGFHEDEAPTAFQKARLSKVSAKLSAPQDYNLHVPAKEAVDFHELSHSAINRHTSLSPQLTTQESEVQDWIRKTSGSPRYDLDNDFTKEPYSEDENEDMGSVRSDIQEVVSLWASKVAQPSEHLPQIQAPSHQVQRAFPELLEEAEERNAGGLNVAGAQEEPSRQSLLSPIDLDNSAFSGPRPDLGGLASQPSPIDQSPQPAANLRPHTAESQLRERVSTNGSDPRTPILGEASDRHRPSPLSLRPYQPPPASISRQSSGELSDSLEQMQKALELLSPGHSPNPGPVPKPEVSKMSSRDSYAFAKTLSASVTPSPRWMSRAKARQSRAEPQTTYVSSDSFFRGQVSPRPASASAAMIGSRRNDVQVPVSASRLAQFNDSFWKDPQVEDAQGHSSVQAPEPMTASVSQPVAAPELADAISANTAAPIDAGAPLHAGITDSPAQDLEMFSTNKKSLHDDGASDVSPRAPQESDDVDSEIAPSQQLKEETVVAASEVSHDDASSEGDVTQIPISSYTPQSGDIEALSGDPEQGMASIERFLRGSSFAESSMTPSTVASPGIISATSDPLVPHLRIQEAGLDVQLPSEPGLMTNLDDSLSEVPTERVTRSSPDSEDRWSQGSHSQSNWTGPSRQSAQSSSGHNRKSPSPAHEQDPETPVFTYERQLGGPRLDTAVTEVKEATTALQSDFANERPEFHKVSEASSLPQSDEASHVGATNFDSENRSFQMSTPVLGESERVNRRSLASPAIRESDLFGSTRVAVREASSSSSSSLHAFHISSSQSSKSPGYMSSLPTSPTSTFSALSSRPRRASASSLPGKRKLALLNLDINSMLKGSSASRSFGSCSPNQRFKALPPSPRLNPNFVSVSSPLSATFPSNSGITNSPSSKLSPSMRALPLSPVPASENLC